MDSLAFRMKNSSKIHNKLPEKLQKNHEVNKKTGKNKLVKEDKEWAFSLEQNTKKTLNMI